MPSVPPNYQNVSTALGVLSVEAKALAENPPDNVAILASIRQLSETVHQLSEDMHQRFGEVDAKLASLEDQQLAS